VHTAHHLVEAECSRKWRLRQETSDGRLLTDGTAGIQLQRERRPQTTTTCQAWYQNELIQIWWHHTIQHSVCHKRQLKVDPFWQTQPVQYRECIRHVVIETKSEYQTSCALSTDCRHDVVEDRQEAQLTRSCHNRAWTGRARPRESENSRRWRDDVDEACGETARNGYVHGWWHQDHC